MSTFNTLSEAELIAKYAKEDAQLKTTTIIAKVLSVAKIHELKNGSKQAEIFMSFYNNKTNKIEFDTFITHLSKGKEMLEQFYAGLGRGQEVLCRYRENNGVKDIYLMIVRK